ncbi:hypothetical protein ACFL1Q_00885 [Patescibacteria group bacterium]
MTKLLSKLLITFLILISAFLLSTKTVSAVCKMSPDPEFHSLRPFPANPCNEKAEELSMICGNDVIIVDNIEVNNKGSDFSKCEQDGDTYTCKYEGIDRSFTVSVDASQSELPIAGNTEMVPNNDSKDNELSSAQRVNDYLSWYLNGVVYRAEEPPLSLRELEDLGKIVNFSGPIRKLLPLRIQNDAREIQVTGKLESGDNLLLGGVIQPTLRHDQTVVCVLRATFDVPLLSTIGDIISFLTGKTSGFGKIQIGGFPIQCPTGSPLKLSEWNNEGRLPPKEENFDNYSDFYKEYKSWLGDTCVEVGIPETIPVIGGKIIYICYNNPLKPDFYSNLFPYVPLSSTEDRIGVLKIHKPVYVDGDVEVDSGNAVFEYFGKNVESMNSKLYFAHMEENSQLSSLLQTSYLPKDLIQDQAIGVTQPVDKTSECKILNVRSNPGDKLFGDNTVGTFTYQATFTCTFQLRTEEVCTGTYYDPETGTYKGDCNTREIYSPEMCEKTARFLSKIDTGTPLAGDIWKKLVAGNASAFKRIFPNLRLSGLGYLYDIPAVTPVIYDSQRASPTDKGGGVAVTNPNAEIYFSHLGGIQEYFLKGIQTMLRPKGFGEPISFSSSLDTSGNKATSREGVTEKVEGESPDEDGSDPNAGCQMCVVKNPEAVAKLVEYYKNPENNINKMVEFSKNGTNWDAWKIASARCVTSDGTPGNCPVAVSGPCQVSNLVNYFEGNWNKARIASMICLQESGGTPDAEGFACLDNVSVDYSVGLFQINLLVWGNPNYTLDGSTGVYSGDNFDWSWCGGGVE